MGRRRGLGPEELGAEQRHATLVWDGLADHIGLFDVKGAFRLPRSQLGCHSLTIMSPSS